jgi:hypothetical protein
MRYTVISVSMLVVLFAGADAAWAGPDEPRGIDAFAGRFYLEHSQGFVFLNGGYVDGTHFYSDLWDEGRSFGLGAGYAPWPALRIGIGIEISGHPHAGQGVDQLDRGHVHLILAFDAPLALPLASWFEPAAASGVRGVLLSATIGGGLGVVDTIWDAFGRIFDRTYTYSFGFSLSLEYRFADFGVFATAGACIHGPLKEVEGLGMTSDPMSSFPLAVGLRVYL